MRVGYAVHTFVALLSIVAIESSMRQLQFLTKNFMNEGVPLNDRNYMVLSVSKLDICGARKYKSKLNRSRWLTHSKGVWSVCVCMRVKIAAFLKKMNCPYERK